MVGFDGTGYGIMSKQMGTWSIGKCPMTSGMPLKLLKSPPPPTSLLSMLAFGTLCSLVINPAGHVPYVLVGAGTASFAAAKAIREKDPKAKVKLEI
jgi:programmed cell death 8 (apoptosis-inducing factor)